MARELSTLLLATTAAGTIKPLTIWNGIKYGKKILEFVGELPEWINYNQNLEEHLQSLKDKMENLESVQADVMAELENTEHQSGKKRKREVNHWIKSVRRKAIDVKKVEDEFSTVSYLPRFVFRAWLGSCIGQEMQQVNELLQQGSFPTGLLLDASRDCREPFVTNVLKGIVVGQKIDEIWEHLLSPTIIRIGVQGPEGIGKSAIMAEVYNRLCPYGNVYYVSVPQDFSVYSLQASIAEEMQVKLQSEESEIRRSGWILKALKSMKAFVLILDGMPQNFELSDLGIPMEGIEGKLIITSRCLDVCKKMLCQKTVLLESMSTEDSESLFLEKLAADAPLSEEIWSVARNIIQKCNGIPLKIIHMAVQLRGVYDVHDWECILSEM